VVKNRPSSSCHGHKPQVRTPRFGVTGLGDRSPEYCVSAWLGLRPPPVPEHSVQGHRRWYAFPFGEAAVERGQGVYDLAPVRANRLHAK